MLFGAAALAVDLGMVQLERRRIQGVADAAALAAARDPGRAATLASAMVAASAGGYPLTTSTLSGRYDANAAPAARFVAGAMSADAVRVSVRAEVPTTFAAILGTSSVAVERRATARRLDLASFAVGSRLVGLDGGVANALLSGLTGSKVALSVMDYEALAGAKVDLLPWLKSLGGDAKIEVARFDDLLATELPTATVLGSLSRQVVDPTARSALNSLASAARGTIRLSHLIDLGELGRQGQGGAGLLRIDTLDLASNIIQGSARGRQVAIDLGAQVPGIAQTRLWVAIGERPNQSPWIAVTRDRSPIIRTAQARVYLEAKLNAKVLPGLSLASVELPLFVELAGAEARLEALRCGPKTVTLAGRPSPGQVAIARIDPTLLSNFKSAVPLSDARLLETLLLRLYGRANIDLGAAATFQTRVFDAAAIDRATVQTIRSTTLTGGVASSLMRNVEIKPPQLLGIVPIPVDPVVKSVGSQLALIAPVLDPVLASVTNLLGVGLGEADLWVTGVRCGQPILIE